MTPEAPSAPTPAAIPSLTAEQLTRLIGYGTPQEVVAGDHLFDAGDPDYDLVVITSGAVDMVRPPTRDAPEEIIISFGAGQFIGELNMLTGQAVYLTARVAEPGLVHRITPERFRHVMATDPELSDVLLKTFLERRRLLKTNAAARSIEIVGSGLSSSTLALRTYAARQQLPHLWFDTDTVAGQALVNTIPLAQDELPAVLTPNRTLLKTTPAELAEHLGLTYRRSAGDSADLVIVGAGPAGLAAAVYGASEGLSTVLLDAVGTGGQAAASPRIENYLGFPSGLSGADLTGRAAVQALKFGARLFSPCRVAELDTTGHQLRIVLADGTDLHTRAVVIATGARYRALPLARWSDFEGAGIYFAATELETRALAGSPVAVIGGANSAGQAALSLAACGSEVTLVVRGPNLSAGMSSYLVDRLHADPRVQVRLSTEVTGLDGGVSLERITVTDRTTGDSTTKACAGLFCFIGAEPATDWLPEVAADEDGFVLTDAQLPPGAAFDALGRHPLPFETSIPAVFAVGDARSGSMKRVAAAVGEGASAVRSVHRALGISV